MIKSVQRFSQAHRLKKADDFSSVFLFRRVKHGEFIKIHYKPNDLGYSRLGLVVGKRVHKRANKRNYMKRLIREYFRLNQNNWLGFDIIVRVIKLFAYNDHAKIYDEFMQLTSKFSESKP